MNTDISIKLGQQIKKLREGRGLSQARLSELALKSVETISNFERGKTTPSVLTLSKLSEVLNVDMKDFFDFENVDKTSDIDSTKLGLLSKGDKEVVSIVVDALCKRGSKA